DECLELTQVLRNWFWRTRKAAVALEIDRCDDASEPIEERGHDHRAGAANAVEGDVKSSPANALDVEVRYREDTFEVSLNRTIIGLDAAQRIPRRARNAFLHERAHLGSFRRLEKQAARPDELEGIPLNRVVTRRDHEPAGGMVIFHRELAGRRRG